jgi:Flp pilus assembly CpaE family ATPase
MAIYILDEDFAGSEAGKIGQQLRTSIPHLIEITRIDEALQEASRSSNVRDVLLLIASTRDKTRMSALTEMVKQHRERLFVIFIGEELSASEYKALVRTGGADWVPASVKPQELLDLIAGARARGRSDAASKGGNTRRPTAISFIPSAGGVGNSTLAIETGIHLKIGKATREIATCIIDLDFQSSHICDYLDIEPRLQIQEILSNPERLDAQLFDIFISKHSSGLHVLASPRSKTHLREVDVPALDVLFDMISIRYEMIFIDLPATWFAWTLQILGASDAAIVTGMNSIPGLRQIAETVVAVRGAVRASSQVAIAVNRCERRLLGGIARQQHIDSVLGRENVYCIAADPHALESINTGTPMTIGRFSRGIGRDIAAIAAFCIRVRAQHATTAPDREGQV